MLCLSRKIGEEIIIGGFIRVKVADIRGNCVRIAIEAPREMSVERLELIEARESQVGGISP